MKAVICKYVFLAFTICTSTGVLAQEVQVPDTLKPEITDKSTMPGITGNDLITQPVETEFISTADAPLTLNPLTISPEAHRIPELADPRAMYGPFSPYNFHMQNFSEGLIMKGISGEFRINDFISTNVNIFASSTYLYPYHRYPYYNASFQMDVIFRLHDRVKLVGKGQLSLREGIDPALPSTLGGANYYGAELQFRITKKFGIGVGFTNSYYRGDWTKRYGVGPVGF